MYCKKRLRAISLYTAVVMVLTTFLSVFPKGILNKSLEAEAATTTTTRTSVHDPSIVKANGKFQAVTDVQVKALI